MMIIRVSKKKGPDFGQSLIIFWPVCYLLEEGEWMKRSNRGEERLQTNLKGHTRGKPRMPGEELETVGDRPDYLSRMSWPKARWTSAEFLSGSDRWQVSQWSALSFSSALLGA